MASDKFTDIDLRRRPERALENTVSADDSNSGAGSKGSFDREDSVATDVLFQPPGRLEKVWGDDDRVRILNTQDYPFRMICKLSMQFPNDPNIYAGTGTLIGPNIVLTCAHNLFDASTGTAHTIECSPGQADTGQTPFGTFNATRMLFPKAYETSNANENDYGAIILDGSPGDIVGWFGYAAPSDSRLRNSILNLTGYPGDPGKNGTQLWHDAGFAMDFDAHSVRYKMDTFGGNSGGPIYAYYKDDPFPLIYGVHTYGAFATVLNGEVIIPEHNGGRRLDHECLDAIAKWRNIAEATLATN